MTFGGEIENPRRNIPLVLVMSLSLIMATVFIVSGVTNERVGGMLLDHAAWVVRPPAVAPTPLP